MNQEKTLIVGKGGQLSSALREILPNATYIGLPEVDLTLPASLNNLNWEDFEIVINATAYTNVDGAETPEGRREAWQVNALAVAELCKVARKHNITLVHVSTDYVFDGTTSPHKEDEPMAPLNVYGQSKVAGECAVQTLEKYYLLRTEWLIGNGKNFVKTMVELGKKGVNPKVVSDQTGRLTFTKTLAEAIVYLLSSNSPFGTYHVTNGGKVTSWAGIAQKVFEFMGASSSVTPISTEEYFKDKPEAAKRPLKSEFDLSKIESTGFHPTAWEEELAKYVASLS